MLTLVQSNSAILTASVESAAKLAPAPKVMVPRMAAASAADLQILVFFIVIPLFPVGISKGGRVQKSAFCLPSVSIVHRELGPVDVHFKRMTVAVRAMKAL